MNIEFGGVLVDDSLTSRADHLAADSISGRAPAHHSAAVRTHHLAYVDGGLLLPNVPVPIRPREVL
jgi:hypothetical protein